MDPLGMVEHLAHAGRSWFQQVLTGGVTPTADVDVAAALDPVGGLLGVGEFRAAVAPARG